MADENEHYQDSIDAEAILMELFEFGLENGLGVDGLIAQSESKGLNSGMFGRTSRRRIE